MLAQLSTAITRINTARPNRDAALSCTVAEVFAWLKEAYSNRYPLPSFNDSEGLGIRNLRIPAFILRNVLMVLLDNALSAIEESGCGTNVTVKAHLEGGFLYIQVSDDGPGVPTEERARILREPLKSNKGQGVGLLYARGAALQYGGDLTFTPRSPGAQFIVTLPID